MEIRLDLAITGTVFLSSPEPPAASNLYPDEHLISADYTVGGGVTHPAGELDFAGTFAGETAGVTPLSDLNAATNAALTASTPYQVSVEVSRFAAGSDSLSVRLQGGAFVNLNLEGTGVSTPVTVTSGAVPGGGVSAVTFDNREEINGADLTITRLIITD